MESTLITLRHAAARYKNKTTIGPLSLSVQDGDFIGVVGPNGSGKTTLLRLLSGQIKPEPVNNAASSGRYTELASRNIAFLFQHHTFTPTVPFSVEDIVYFGRVGARGLGRRYTQADHQAVRDALAAMQLQPYRQRLYRELSGGEKQKTQFARLLAQQADLLLLDEPTAGLDPDWQERMTALTGDLHRRHGKTMVMVTHDIDRLPACCNRTVLLHNGQILAQGTPEECLRGDLLEKLYGCPMEIVRKDGRYHSFSRGGGRA